MVKIKSESSSESDNEKAGTSINKLLLNLTNKTKFLHKGLQDLNPQSDSDSDDETPSPRKNFSPLAVSTQVKESPKNTNNKKNKLKPSVKPKNKEVIPPPKVNLNGNKTGTEDSDSDSTDSDSEPSFKSNLLQNIKVKLAEKERDDTSEESSVDEKAPALRQSSSSESSSDDEPSNNKKQVPDLKKPSSSESSSDDEPSNNKKQAPDLRQPSSSESSSDEEPSNNRKQAPDLRQSSSSESSSDDEPSNNKKHVTPQRKPANKEPSSSGKKTTKQILLQHRPIKQEKQSTSSESSSDEEQITPLKKKTIAGKETHVNKKQVTPQIKKNTKAASSSSEEETVDNKKKTKSGKETHVNKKQVTPQTKKSTKAASSSSEEETPVSPQKSKLKKDESSSSEDSSPQKAESEGYSSGEDFSPRQGASNKKVNVLQNVTLQSARSPKTDPAIQPIADLLSNLSDSEEMILLQVPKNLKLSESQCIDLSGKDKLKFDKEKYVVKPMNEIKNGLLVTDKPRSVRFGGHYILQKYVKNIDKVPIVVPTKSSVPMPENLKIRHPFFGANYKEKINLDELIEQKLKQAIEDVSKSEKKRKKKKRKDSDIEEKPLIFDLLSAHSINKSRKSDNTTIDSSTDSPAQKKKKKSKLVTKIKEEIEDPVFKQVFQSPPLKTKIKKEKFDDFEIENTPLVTGRPSIINSTLIPGAFKSPKFNAEVSRITSETPRISSTPDLNNSKKKKKKKDKSKVDDPLTQDLLSNILNSVKTEIGTVENKRKHSVSGEITEGIKKKKKSKK